MQLSQTGPFWSKLPLPVLLIGVVVLGFFAMLVTKQLAGWFGGSSLFLAMICWMAVVAGLLHAAGKLPWLSGRPHLSAALDTYAPRELATRTSGPLRSASPRTAVPPPDVSHFAGLKTVNSRLRDLIEHKGMLANKLADAPLLLLLGPRGTGKTSIAQSLPPRLQQAGIVKTDNVVAISTKALPGLTDSQGPDVHTLNALSTQLDSAVDGIVLLDNLDYLLSLAGGDVVREIGVRLADLARTHRGRLVVIGTGSAETLDRLDPGREWVSHFDPLLVEFPKLDITALETIASQLFRNDRLLCTPPAAAQLNIELQWLSEDDAFINAYAVRTLVGEILHAKAARLRSEPAKDPVGASEVIEADIPRRSGT